MDTDLTDRLPSLPVPAAADLLPVAPGAVRAAALLGVAGVLTTLVVPLLGIPLLLGVPATLLFYRDPARESPPAGVVAPADGVVAVLRREDDGRVRLGTYMRPRDVHVTRAPVGGRLRAVEHEPGGHLPAQTKLAERNEKTHVRYDGADVTVTMIAGAVARRITAYRGAGDRVRRGDRLGHIAFGSRTDLLLPAAVDPGDVAVEPGQRVRAGETVVVDPSVFDPRPDDEGTVAGGSTGAATVDGGRRDG